MSGKKWSEEDVQFIKDNYLNMTCEEIGKQIGRTKYSVQHVSRKLNLERPLPKIGDKIGQLTVLEVFTKFIHGSNSTMVTCECDCGNKNLNPFRMYELINGDRYCCGCDGKRKLKKVLLERNTTHGKSQNNRLYRIWRGTKTRCYTPCAIGFENYGGRGISVCDEWREDFLTFEKWAMENGYDDNLSIDRIDVNGNYTPENCKWSNRIDQANNTRKNVFIEAFGESKTIPEWSRDPRAKTSLNNIRGRINRGWEPEKAISTSTQDPRENLLYFKGTQDSHTIQEV
jgi:hypothetical protein